ncbi:hypothetical protein BDF22DRAFT_672103 [Syncephalis plumigaleata]|nr:hypothetical protein BDF22DRAFT_672103 [Syncephalis plumigaleata]
MHLLIKQLLLTGIMAGAMMVDRTAAECEKVFLRREIRDLSESELSQFTSTLWKFMSQENSPYHEYANVHNSHHTAIHGVPEFLPWHRVMLSDIENAIRKTDPDFVLPYWDWSLDSQNPAASDIFTDKYFGGNGYAPQWCINSGPFKDHKPVYVLEGTPNCLTRYFSNQTVTNTIGAFVSMEVVTAIVRNTTDFGQFWPSVEGVPHSVVHNNIGGGFATMYSPNDPLFFVHHNYIDKIWADWQELVGDQADYSVLDLEKKLPYWNATTSQVLQTEKSLCYKYAPPVKAYEMHQQNFATSQQNQQQQQQQQQAPPQQQQVPPQQQQQAPVNALHRRSPNYQATKPATPSNPPVPSAPMPVNPETTTATTEYSGIVDVTMLQSTPKLPDAWCKMNGLNITRIREQERVTKEFVEMLNQIPNYVSPCALWNRESMMKRLVQTGKVKTFTATMNGRTVGIPVTPGSNPTDAVARTKRSFIQAGIRVPNIVQSITVLSQALGTEIAQGLGQLLNITSLLGGLLQGGDNSKGLLNNVPIVSGLLGGGKLSSASADTDSNRSNSKNKHGNGILGLGASINADVNMDAHTTSQPKLASSPNNDNNNDSATNNGSAYGNRKYTSSY